MPREWREWAEAYIVDEANNEGEEQQVDKNVIKVQILNDIQMFDLIIE